MRRQVYVIEIKLNRTWSPYSGFTSPYWDKSGAVERLKYLRWALDIPDYKLRIVRYTPK